MTIRRLFIFLLVIAAVSLRVETHADDVNGLPDHKGTDFYVAFPQNISASGLSNLVPTLTVSVAVEKATRIQVTAQGFATFTVDVADDTVQDLPAFPGSSWQLTPNTVDPEEKGIRIRSIDASDDTKDGAPVSVFVVSRRPGSTGGYLALPVDALGTTYRVAAWHGIPPTGQGSQVTVIGTVDGTIATITAPGSMPFDVPLNSFQTYLLQFPIGDLTGTLVTATEPVAVLGGAAAAIVPGPGGSPDFVVEQMTPVPTWGREFIVPPIASRSAGDVIRVLAHEDGTEVKVNGTLAATLDAGRFHQFTQPSNVPGGVAGSWIQTSKPVLVAQYNKSGTADFVPTDPFMMLIPPVNQMSDRYLVRSAPTLTGSFPFFNSLAVVAPVREGTGIHRASNDGFSGAFSSTWTEIPDSAFEYARIANLAREAVVHLIAHDSGEVPFGLFVYGRAAADGYGYVGGQLVADLNPPIVSAPDDVTKEATGPDGAMVTWDEPTATDFGRGELDVSCDRESNSLFALGTKTVKCTATDPAGNTTTARFSVKVQDTTAPTLAVPADTPLEATGPNGAVVSFDATASDLVDTDVDVSCTPASGSTLSIGVHLVTCTATDLAGNTATASFSVTVQDTTAPTLAVPANTQVEATGPNGAVVSFDATASDLVDTDVGVSCTPASGSTFRLGLHKVTCTATDDEGNTATGTFTVTVRDTAPPVLETPVGIVRHATGPEGAVVKYEVRVIDTVSKNVEIVCTPRSGSTFPLGPDKLTLSTTVTCMATDESGNSTTKTFPVKVTNSAATCAAALPSFSIVLVPRNQLLPVGIRHVTDPDGDDLSITVKRIFQDEPTGRTADAAGVGSSQASIRTEREQRGNGRIYDIEFTAIDAIGARCSGAVKVAIPIEFLRPAVDDGARYNSTVVSEKRGRDREDDN